MKYIIHNLENKTKKEIAGTEILKQGTRILCNHSLEAGEQLALEGAVFWQKNTRVGIFMAEIAEANDGAK
jgi:hypothetical protein